MANDRTPPWESFPPQEEKARLDLYGLYKRALLGDRGAFVNQMGGKKHSSELSKVKNAAARAMEGQGTALNYLKTVATTYASKMFGTDPLYRAGDADSDEQVRLDKIVTDNTLNNTNIEQAISSVALGGAVYRTRWGRMRNWREPMPIIEAIPVQNYFAVLSPDNIKDNAAAALAFSFDMGDETYVKLEKHEPYQITHELWKLDGDQFGHTVPFSAFDMFAGLDAGADEGGPKNVKRDGDAIIEETGYSGLFVEYVPNFVLPDEYYGHSDYDNLMMIQRDINETSNGILQVILKHIDPKLIVPPGTLQYDEKRDTWYVVKEDLGVVEVPKDVGAVLPRYVTWDAQLGAARANMDALFESFMIIADISLPILGITKYGTAESAAALELKMTQTTDAVHRKRMYYDTALKNILYAAQHLDVEYGGQPYEPQDVSITWPSPVPMDKVTETDMHAARLGAGLESRRTAVAAVQKIAEDALDGELDEIANDRAASATAFSGFGERVVTGDGGDAGAAG